ncbi:hypothetical protein Bpfe_001846 [Biomphalaria pfeifferi]|uniref:Uncharacterized protein n=1 Tax=Biomphalaria pfeifferi TaxID=112525 RepID=A0AAD8FM12_BIOPF|nr:hypothetical protein Bpfe_001846 [Biomphalaria pfeifferi]
MDYNSIEKSIRCFVSRSDVNVITKRMKQGQPLESLRLIDVTNTKVEPNNIPPKTHEKCKVNLKASNIKNTSKTKLVNSYSTRKNEIHIEEDRSKSNLDKLNFLNKKTKSSEHLEGRRRNHNHFFRDLFSDKHYSNSLTAKSVKKNRLPAPKYFSADEVRLSILNSDDSQQSCDSICSEQFLPDRAEVFSSWEEEVALLDSNNTHTSDSDCDQEESKGNICVKVVNSNVLANDSESKVNDDDCFKIVNSNVLANDSKSKVNDDNCVEIGNSNVLVKDCYLLDSKVREIENMSLVTSKKNEVIVIDSSPDIDTTKMKTKIDGSRNWLSVFSKDDVKALISTNLFQDSAYKLPIISIEKLENGSSQYKLRHSFTVLKTGCEKTKTVEADSCTSPEKTKTVEADSCASPEKTTTVEADSCTSPEKKRRKTSKNHTEKKYSKKLLVSDHSLISFQTDTLKSSQRIKGNILQESLPMDQEIKELETI